MAKMTSAGWNSTCVITAGALACGGSSGVSLAASGSLSVHVSSTTNSTTSCGTVANSASATSGNDGAPSVGPVSITVDCLVLSITMRAPLVTGVQTCAIPISITVSNAGPGT